MEDQLLVSGDVGNSMLKWRGAGDGKWHAEPATVRSAGDVAYSFSAGAPVRPLRYLGGPAGLDDGARIIGRDSDRAGMGDETITGDTATRVQSDAYLFLHMYLLAANVTSDQTSVTFYGGLPIKAAKNDQIKQALKQRLIGEHRLLWGARKLTITVEDARFAPQPVAAVATYLYDERGMPVATNAIKQRRLALDIGGGTTDLWGGDGLTGIRNSEGTINLGMWSVAGLVARAIGEIWPLTNPTPMRVMDALRKNPNDPIWITGGEQQRIISHVQRAAKSVSDEILQYAEQTWNDLIPSAQIVTFGGGGATMYKNVQQRWSRRAPTVLLHPKALYAVADGLWRMALNMNGRKIATA